MGLTVRIIGSLSDELSFRDLLHLKIENSAVFTVKMIGGIFIGG